MLHITLTNWKQKFIVADKTINTISSLYEIRTKENREQADKLTTLQKLYDDEKAIVENLKLTIACIPEYNLVSLATSETIHELELKEFEEANLLEQLKDKVKSDLLEGIKEKITIEESVEFHFHTVVAKFNYYEQI